MKISFTNSPLTEVLKLYQNLKDKRIRVSEPLRQKLVSISSEELVTRGEAIKLIESSLLDDYGIRIEQSDGTWQPHPETGRWIRIGVEQRYATWLDVLGPNEVRNKTPLLPLVIATAIRCPRLPQQDDNVEMIFDKTPLAVALELYEKLVGKPVQVSEDLRNRPVSVNSKGKIPRSAAIKLIESQLRNYDIRIVEQEGALVAVGPKYEGAGTPTESFRATVRGNRYVFTFKGNGLLGSASVSGTNAFNFNVIGLKRNLIDMPPRPNDWLYKLWPNP